MPYANPCEQWELSQVIALSCCLRSARTDFDVGASVRIEWMMHENDLGCRRKRTPGSTLLRAILSKFAKTSKNMVPEDFGPTFEGGDPIPLTAEEDRLRTRTP